MASDAACGQNIFFERVAYHEHLLRGQSERFYTKHEYGGVGLAHSHYGAFNHRLEVGVELEIGEH